MRNWLARKRVRLILTLLFCAAAGGARSAGAGEFSGNVFGDGYWMAANHRPDLVGQYGFRVRKVRLIFDRAIGRDFATRLRLDMVEGTEVPELYVKEAFLRCEFGSHQLYIGISRTPTWLLVNRIWGLRPVERTPVDLQKMGNSRDVGLALRGKLDREGKVAYHAMLGNGAGVQSDADAGKKVYLCVDFYPDENLVIQAYGDWERRSGSNEEWATIQGFLAYRADKFRLGVLYATQVRQSAGKRVDLPLVSFFGVRRLRPRWAVFARVDRMFHPNPAGETIRYLPFDSSAESTFLVFGLDYALAPSVHFMPNLEMIHYSHGTQAAAVRDDVIPRVVFYYVF